MRTGSVLYFYGEGCIEEDYLPYFISNGADVSKIRFLDGAEYFEGLDSEAELGQEAEFSLKDIDTIEAAIQMTAEQTGLPVKLVIVDTIGNYWRSGIRENSNTDVKSVLKPLQRLAEKTASFLLVQHTGKADKECAQQKVMGEK